MKQITILMNRPLLLCLFFVLLGKWSFSQEEINLYEGAIPDALSAENIETQNPRQSGGAWITKVSQPTLTSYLVQGSEKPSPAILICPGGGYGGLAIEKEGHDIALAFQKNGISAFVLKYRMPSERTMIDKSKGPLQDAQQAMAVIRSNADRWQVDPGKVGVIGFSAGGHLASSLATRFHKPVLEGNTSNVRPDFVILMYPVISFKDSIGHIGSRNNLIGKNPPAEMITAFSSEENVTTDTPPAFLVHAGNDKIVKVENTIAFYQALLQHQVKAQMHIYPEGGHGFGLNNRTTQDKWFDHCLLWLKDCGIK
ncbi:alpha/beta hydrolase [Sphingobacterium paucimobilis]|uniref:BD-FAE-like domain-containing protein n=1 Tax=Sphingobacterium paucimobilis HER1398 TaxID=1346330 RepID=U2HPN6_9SPHI|nr:alpha/beta hydrolase [Sphingobacterium paucimobilis]ERJ57427.1 hypothetical protein M472_01475 [Sphingobacterium paucimobilis HER1398]